MRADLSSQNQKMEGMSRVRRTKDEAKEYYDKISRWYDVLSGKKEKKLSKAGLEKLSIAEGEVVLEIGYGTGRIIKELAELVGPEGRVYGTDISEGMKEKALSRIDEDKLGRVRLECDDAAKLPYRAEMFDSIFIGFTLELFDTPELPVVLKECDRVLKKNGKICVLSMSKRKLNPMVNLYEWSHRKFPKYIDCRPIYTEELVREAGFQIVEKEEKSLFGLPVDIIVVQKAGSGAQ